MFSSMMSKKGQSHSHVSLSLDDGVDILTVDHTQHPVAEHARGCGFHHDEDQEGNTANTNLD